MEALAARPFTLFVALPLRRWFYARQDRRIAQKNARRAAGVHVPIMKQWEWVLFGLFVLLMVYFAGFAVVTAIG